MIKNLWTRRCLALGFAALLAGSVVSTADAAQRSVGASGTSSGYGGQRNVVYVPGWGYWIFFKEINSDRPVWRFSKDGQDWTAAQDIFPFLQTLPDAAAPEPSVWYVDNLKRVYVAAGDAASDITGSALATDLSKTDGSGNKIFVRWGTLNSSGGITWDTTTGIRRQRATIRLAASQCQYTSNTTGSTVWDVQGGGKPATVVYSSSTLGSYVSVFANTDNALTAVNNMGAIGVTNLSADLSGYVTGSPSIYVFCNENDGGGGYNAPEVAASAGGDPTVLNPAGLAVAPVTDNGSAHFVMGARLQNMDPDATIPLATNGNGALIRLSSTSVNLTNLDGTDAGGGTTITGVLQSLDDLIHAYNPVDATPNNTEGFSFATINEIARSTAHFAYVTPAGQLFYRRKNDVATVTAGFTLDTMGTTSFPVINPAMSYLYDTGGVAGSNSVYTLWVSSASDTLYYRACYSTATSAVACGATVGFRTGSNIDFPKPSFWVSNPEPISVLWTDDNGVYFDKIITSTYAAPAGITVSTAVAFNAFLTTPRYDVLVNGNNFEYMPTASTPTPRFLILASSETQSTVSVTSVTWISKTQMRASIVLSTSVNAGFDYDMRYVQGDGQEYPTRYDRNNGATANVGLPFRLDAPAISGVADFDAAPNLFTSGGTLLSNNGTANLSRALRVFGAGYQNWTGLAGTVLPSTNTVRVRFQNVAGDLEPNIMISSLAYTGSTMVTAFLKISTAVAGGQYRILLTNPSSGTALSLSSTFYVTVPTASVTGPGPGNSLGFTVVKGTVGFNNVGQTSIAAAAVRVTHVATGKVWNGSVMTTAGFATEEDKWKSAALSPSATAYAYGFDTSNTGAIPDDGTYEIAARAQTSDGGIGDPYYPAQVSTHAVNLDRFPPTAAISLPVAGSTNSATRIVFDFSDLGTGLTTTQILVQDVGIPTGSTDTWISFNSTGTLHYRANEQVWLSTDVNGTPVTIFNPAQVGAVQIDITAATSLKLPQWQDGRKYRVSGYARDDAGRFVDQSTAGASSYTTFIYDITRPTVTVTSPAGLATSSGTATWVTTFDSIGGAIKDNVADALDQQHVFVRVAELLPGAPELVNRWLRPTDFVFTNSISPDQAYKEIVQTLSAPEASDPWSWDISAAGAQLTDGLVYRVEVYAADSAGNSTGTAVSPVLRYYLRLDRTSPIIQKVQLSTQPAPTDNTGVVFSTASTIGLYQSSNPLTSIRLHLTDGSGSGIADVDYYLRFDGVAGNFQWDPVDPSSWVFEGAPTEHWQQATSTTTPNFKVALSTSILWLNSQSYYLRWRVTDVAGNITFHDWSFTYDTSSPTITGINISSGVSFSDSADLPNAITGLIVDELNQVGKVNAGPKQVGVGVRRQSDNFWFRVLAANWQVGRADPLITSFSGNSWSLTPLGSQSGSFWESRSTETYSLYTWGQDNVAAPFENINDSGTLRAVFHWEVQAPTSTFVFPSTSTNLVWYSSHSGFNLAAIQGTAFDQPASGPGHAQNVSCSMSGGPGGWPGASPNICAEEVEIQDTGSGLCWNGSAFAATCGSASAFRTMTVQSGRYSFDTQIGVGAGLWETMVTGGIYRARLRGKDAGVTSGGVWRPNTEVPAAAPDCLTLPLGAYNARCFRVDKQAPTTVINDPVHNTDITAPVAAINGTIADAHSGPGKVFIAVCRDLAGAPDLNNCLSDLTGSANFTTPLTWFELPGTPWSLNTSAVTAWTTTIFYHVLARSSDTVNNVEGVNGAAALNSNHIRFRIVSPTASGDIVRPSNADPTFPFYQPANLTTITGTATGNSHAQLRVRETDTDLYLNYNGTAWVAGSTWTTSPTGAAINPALPRDWTYAFGGTWRVNHNYTVDLRVCNSVEGGCTGTLDTETFVIDSSAPVNNVTNPSIAAHRAGQLGTLSGSVLEVTAPAQPNSLDTGGVYFRVVRIKDGREWNVLASTFVVAPGDNLLATDAGGGLFTYTTTYLTTDAMFESGYQYRVNLTAADKAGNSATANSALFRYDVSLPTAAFMVPLPTAKINTPTPSWATPIRRPPASPPSRSCSSASSTVSTSTAPTSATRPRPGCPPPSMSSPWAWRPSRSPTPTSRAPCRAGITRCPCARATSRATPRTCGRRPAPR